MHNRYERRELAERQIDTIGKNEEIDGVLKYKRIKRYGELWLLGTIFLVGMALLLYPSFSDYWNSFHQSRAIMDYAAKVSDMDKAEYETIIGRAKEYNRNLTKRGIKWKLSEEERNTYDENLNFEDSGIMGYISIPKIDVELPIYHGTSEGVLQKAIGHMEGSSLPVGGLGTHTMLSGHRGLPSARLFSDLDKLLEGDIFTINVLNETLTYKVDQIRIVEPSDLSLLLIDPEMDYCTLVTCTPYGINTHRLLVRGHRIENLNGNADMIADAIQIRPIYIIPFLMVPLVLFLIIMVLIDRRLRHRQ